MPEWLVQIMTAMCGAAGLYAAVRADLAALHVKADTAQRDATRANERIDAMRTCGN